MRFISIVFFSMILFIFSCGSDNTIKPKWNGCISDNNCEEGQKCIAGKCEESNNCKTDKDCLNGQFCNKNELCENYCETNDDCGVGFVCNQESKKCEKDPNVHLCEKDSECNENEICKDYKCIPKDDKRKCQSDTNCFNGQHCSNGYCIENCTENSCKDGYFCNEETKECEKTSCSRDSDCKDGYYCENKECKTKEYSCSDTVQCFNGYECKDGICKPVNTECETAQDCNGPINIDCMGAHWECKENKCVQECGEQRCETAQDCNGPIYIECYGAHWECRENICVPECGNNEKCGNNVCDEELGENYINCPQDCRDNHCDDGTQPMCDMMPPVCKNGTILAYYRGCYACVDPLTCEPVNEECQTDYDCNDGYVCIEGVCKPYQNECVTDNDCDDGDLCTIEACREGICVSNAVRCPQDMICNPETGRCENDSAICGNGRCEIGENEENCPTDCSDITPSCEEDQFENNDNISQSAFITEGLYNNLTITYDDEDWYSINYNGQDTLIITLGFINLNGDIDIYAFQDGRQISSSEGYQDNETLIITPRNFHEGEILINAALIRNPNEPYHECQTYSMKISSDNNPDICIPDEYEDNNIRRNAARIPEGTYNNLTLCENDTDWYLIQLSSLTYLKVTTTNFPSELYIRGTREPIAVSRNIEGKEVLRYYNDNEDARSVNVFLKVFRDTIVIDELQTDYTMTISKMTR